MPCDAQQDKKKFRIEWHEEHSCVCLCEREPIDVVSMCKRRACEHSCLPFFFFFHLSNVQMERTENDRHKVRPEIWMAMKSNGFCHCFCCCCFLHVKQIFTFILCSRARRYLPHALNIEIFFLCQYATRKYLTRIWGSILFSVACPFLITIECTQDPTASIVWPFYTRFRSQVTQRTKNERTFYRRFYRINVWSKYAGVFVRPTKLYPHRSRRSLGTEFAPVVRTMCAFIIHSFNQFDNK